MLVVEWKVSFYLGRVCVSSVDSFFFVFIEVKISLVTVTFSDMLTSQDFFGCVDLFSYGKILWVRVSDMLIFDVTNFHLNIMMFLILHIFLKISF